MSADEGESANSQGALAVQLVAAARNKTIPSVSGFPDVSSCGGEAPERRYSGPGNPAPELLNRTATVP